jgi:hypothetical protein
MRFRVCPVTGSICNCWVNNLRPVGPLGGKWRTVGWEGRGVVCSNWHLQGYSPRLCRLRVDGLVVASKY